MTTGFTVCIIVLPILAVICLAMIAAVFFDLDGGVDGFDCRWDQ